MQCKWEGRLGQTAGEASFRQAVLGAAMCKQLYWNWISSFTSGIRLEEQRALDEKALKQQVEPSLSTPGLILVLGA